ncbi:enoyl-CoA hydratase/isomerase family protein [Mycobacterium angelicum]|uniref:enoyl-CoA hydratase/isomerase family protein n=1 Tax=Mycobacterium angelicum TaxID=470074 RepID=UPI001FE2D439|nr:enoyl-CoA hydratase/isomerase family protein [Mycobacterium angelicum]
MGIDYMLRSHIVTITINRPEARNSLDVQHFRDLAHAWAEFRDDPTAWVAVVTGTGRDFCSGADLKKFIPELTGALPRPLAWNKTDAIHAVSHRFPIYKPIVAAVNGVCVAGGLEMLGSTDIRIAVPQARFGVTEPKRGLFAGIRLSQRDPAQRPDLRNRGRQRRAAGVAEKRPPRWQAR